MKLVITERSLYRLEDALIFYIEELEIPKETVLEIKNRLMSRAKSLINNPYKGQYEPYLQKLNKDHRRLIEGNFKIIYRLSEDKIYVTDFFDSRKSPLEMRG